MIAVTSIMGVDRALKRLRPRFILSLSDPGVRLDYSDVGRHLHIETLDTTVASDRPGFPNIECVRRILEFGAEWSGHDPMLVFCTAAHSRSPAAAALLIAQKFPDHVERIARNIARKLPQARPNPRLIEAGDDLLGLNGRLITAVKAMPGPTLRDFQDRFATIPFPISEKKR